MKTLLLLIFPLFLISCGYVSKSTLHSTKDWKSFTHDPDKKLPPAAIKAGERTLAYKHRIGFPPMFGGYLPSLLAADPEIVRAELDSRGAGSDTYLTGLKPGTTTIYFANGYVRPGEARKDLRTFSQGYRLKITE